VAVGQFGYFGGPGSGAAELAGFHVYPALQPPSERDGELVDIAYEPTTNSQWWSEYAAYRDTGCLLSTLSSNLPRDLLPRVKINRLRETGPGRKPKRRSYRGKPECRDSQEGV
jgi:hypothetical protein